MQDEIEIKIMLLPENIALIKQWLTQQPIQKYQRQTLGNTYFDTPELFLQKHRWAYEYALKTISMKSR